MILKGKLQWSGILKLHIDPEENEIDLPTKGLTLNKKLHITLVHQECFKLLEFQGKQFNKYLKKNTIKNNQMEVEIDINLTSASIFEEKNKKTLVFFVTDQCQKELQSLVQVFFKEYGLKEQFNSIRPNTPDNGRLFHLSYSNATGNPGDSIAVVW